MKTFQLSAEVREDKGKKLAKQLRKQGLVPAVIYGDGKEATMLSVKSSSLRNLLYTPDIHIVELALNGKVKRCIVQDIQFHPVTDSVLHIDFLEVREDKPIVIEVPVKLDGHAAGVRAGGSLQLDMRKLRVKALYEHIPDRLHIDVTPLKLGKTIQVGELSFDNLELLNAKNAVVCAVRATRASRSAASAATDDEETEEGADSAE
ncbi:MAG: 50S ribosomal protein L25/general stress protein Ctc [Bacteroidales bacterium]|uniref:50S ribosomal protein L25/general stress protein Ctc n=1 Tax=Porphyromonas sp. TaxID=1924944 RepID=UPI0029725BF1|nr:50S ribosomal protein L25/general stress protein Ctc [Porphyromonas sp.]MDD7437698.1 50S ribosomal protein L25/general stress protein Ctc [Bacteroidales bacterium]MDY3067382.1 50S ribosomal protein L25/general stress protein Ctc [Porphyromonas sp.]